MTNYQKKSENSYKSGEILKKEGQYDSCTHCFYYACLQMMKLVKEKDTNVQRNFNRSTAGGVHEQLISSIRPDMIMKSYVDSIQFSTEIQELRFLRVKADYEDILLTAAEATDALLYSENIINLLKKNYSV